MPRETREIASRTRVVKFSNGTVLEVHPFAGEATQWLPSAGGLRFDRRPAEQDLSPDFQRALGEVGIRETETVYLAVTGHSKLQSYRSGRLGNDQVVLRPGGKWAVDEIQVVLYQDESGGLSWHFPDGFLEGQAD